MYSGERIDASKPKISISARIDTDVYEYFQREEIPMSDIVRILLQGFVTSEDRLGLLMQCLESDAINKIDADEKILNAFAKERLGTSLWSEEFVKLYRDLKKLP